MSNTPTKKSSSKAPVKFIATGKRKTARAQVRLHLEGSGQLFIKTKPKKSREATDPRNAYRSDVEFFGATNTQRIEHVRQPLTLFKEIASTVDVYVTTSGGGVSGQADSIRLGIARALEKMGREKNDLGNIRAELSQHGLLTRDSRKKERKKYGLHKARKATQFSKR